MKIPTGDEAARNRDRWFADSNSIRFSTPISDEIVDWWKNNMFDPFGLTPEGLAGRFSASWEDDRWVEYKAIDPHRPEIEFTVHGSTGNSTIWLIDRCVDLAGNVVDARQMQVAEDRHHLGIGRRLMRDTIETARFLGMERIKLEADDVGRYAWVRMGFLPDGGSWRSIREACFRTLTQFSDTLGIARAQEIATLLMSKEAVTMRLIADLQDPVESPRLRRPADLEPRPSRWERRCFWGIVRYGSRNSTCATRRQCR